ncbi:protein of unknown function [Devosia lucknowensis]|uniref:YjiS-like domain-containing protein n=1 Tax=Devosia lucknowensis TaxID=1096929 RepID=A0A1Y6FKD3_9HYPH|nr:DUF1127 domain-containing protein [Devosia lucknowensis]SMQ72903.1 protein of unknown function [Devosia lucknowensis]
MIDILDTWRKQRRINKTRRQLNGLSDHMLSDIGISRSDIASYGRVGMSGRQTEI